MQYVDWLQSPYYKKVNQKLTVVTRAANRELAATLDAIPRRVHQRSR